MAKLTIIDGVRFVIGRAQMNGFNAIAPVMALAWVNRLRDGELKHATLKQVCAAFNDLGRRKFIRKTRRAENAWLDMWEIVPNVQIEGQAASGLSRSNAGLADLL
jgi:hypothetical protein